MQAPPPATPQPAPAETTAEANARHLAILREVTDLCLAMVRATAGRALAEAEEGRRPPPEAKPARPRETGQPLATRRPDGDRFEDYPAPTRPLGRIDPGQLFDRLVRQLRATVAQEATLRARIDAEAAAARRLERDPRRAHLMAHLNEAAAATPEPRRAELEREIPEWVSREIEADPAQKRTRGDLMSSIAAGLHLDPYPRTPAALVPAKNGADHLKKPEPDSELSRIARPIKEWNGTG